MPKWMQKGGVFYRGNAPKSPCPSYPAAFCVQSEPQTSPNAPQTLILESNRYVFFIICSSISVSKIQPIVVCLIPVEARWRVRGLAPLDITYMPQQACRVTKMLILDPLISWQQKHNLMIINKSDPLETEENASGSWRLQFPG